MKKKKILLFVGLLLVASIATATLFNSKEEAFSYFNTMKTTREQNIESTTKSFVYTSDKICKIRYKSEKSDCNACVNWEYNGKEIIKCYPLDEDTTLEQDNEQIKNMIQEQINIYFPREEVEYKVADRIGIKVS